MNGFWKSSSPEHPVLSVRVVILFITGLLLLGACSESPRLQRLAPDAVVLAFGDSITYGTGAPKGTSYPAVLQQLIDRKVINAGIPGEISANGLARLPELLDSVNPQLIILCHGGNDILRKHSREQMHANLRAMIKLARDRNIDVVLLGVPEFSLLNHDSLSLYSELAEEFAIPYEGDIIPEIEYTKSLKSDPIHPNADGYRRIAEAIRDVLQDANAI